MQVCSWLVPHKEGKPDYPHILQDGKLSSQQSNNIKGLLSAISMFITQALGKCFNHTRPMQKLIMRAPRLC